MNWLLFVLVFGVGMGLLACWLLIMSHVEEARARRRLDLHQWMIEVEREDRLKQAAAPLLYRGYRMPKRDQ